MLMDQKSAPGNRWNESLMRVHVTPASVLRNSVPCEPAASTTVSDAKATAWSHLPPWPLLWRLSAPGR